MDGARTRTNPRPDPARRKEVQRRRRSRPSASRSAAPSPPFTAPGSSIVTSRRQNVMVADDGRVVLMDFGTGLVIDGGTAPPAGTPLYLAPELVAGGEAGTRSDVYSVGVLLFHLLTGTYPVVAQDVRGLRAAHERGERRSVRSLAPDTPQELALVLERALEPQPERRQPTADALGAELVKAAHGPQRRARLRRAAAAPIAASLWRSSSGRSPLVQRVYQTPRLAARSLPPRSPARARLRPLSARSWSSRSTT